jgi:hypothetical protein
MAGWRCLPIGLFRWETKGTGEDSGQSIGPLGDTVADHVESVFRPSQQDLAQPGF